MRVGILTGGGDVPGLNPCIKAAVQAASEQGIKMVGIRRGWAGLLEYNPDDDTSRARNFLDLNVVNTRTVDRTGGTFLHTSRTNPGRVRKDRVPDFLKSHVNKGEKFPMDFTPHVLKNIEKLGIDALIAIGGDDTLSYAERLHHEGMRVVAIPKTMDNDVYGTDYCIGFSTAISLSVNFIHQLRTSTGSHERIAIIELFGRNSGETSLLASYLAGTERSIISEVPFDVEKLAKLIVADKLKNPSNYAMIAISEGASMIGGNVVETGQEDAYGHKKLGGIGHIAGEAIKKITGEDILYQQVGYLMRSGAPDSLDLMVSMNYASMAINLIKRGESNRLMAIRNGAYTSVPISTISTGERRVDVDALYDADSYRPKIKNIEGKPMFLY
ncbi:MAG: 6-phosphofructokinase [Holophagales bacterium]|jgi:6-phosphofructokinase 1|nr:6-phosphofructokinase [Holophagales bacterium]